MTLYRKKHSQPFKWLLALIVFAAAMCFTLSDVYGFQVDSRNSDTDTKYSYKKMPSTTGCEDPQTDFPSGSTNPVPEPGTLILVAGGLTALYTARKLRNRNANK